MLLGAGIDPHTDEPRAVELTDQQAESLGLPSEPQLLGCGTQACAYLGIAEDEVIKITRDSRDARMSFIVMANPQPWAIPIRNVWRLPSGVFAIVADRADPLHSADPQLATAFDQMWAEIAKQNLDYSGWPNYREIAELNLDDDLSEQGETDEIMAKTRALVLADEAITGFGQLGMGWLDFHGGNWGLHGGRPVVIDLGLSAPLDEPPVKVLAETRGIPRIGSGGAGYLVPEERIGTLDDACPVVRAAELSGGDMERLKVRTVFATGTGVRKRNLPLVNNPADAARAISEAWGDSDREVFIVLLLNHKNRLLGVHEAAIGSVSAVEVHPRETLKAAVVAGASAIIVGHIHPSGDPTPSQQDRDLTDRLREAAELLGIKLLDHVVVGEGSWQSIDGERGSLPIP